MMYKGRDFVKLESSPKSPKLHARDDGTSGDGYLTRTGPASRVVPEAWLPCTV